MAALRAVCEGSISLEQQIVIEAKYQRNDSGVFQFLRPGLAMQIRDALIMMIIVSDNTCTGTIVDMLGLDYINEFCHAMGMRNTRHRFGIPPMNLARDHPVDASNATTASEVASLLGQILQGSLDSKIASRLGCTPSLCEFALDVLSWQRERCFLPSLLPEATRVAHKTGTGKRGHHDAGVVYYQDRPLFVLVVFTDNVPQELSDRMPGSAGAANLIGQMCRRSYDYLKEFPDRRNSFELKTRN
jgi:beta-lactamase class A